MHLLTQLALFPAFIAALTRALPLGKSVTSLGGDRPPTAFAGVSEQRPFQYPAAALPLPSLYTTAPCVNDSGIQDCNDSVTPGSCSVTCARAKLTAIWDRLQDKYRKVEQEEPRPRVWFFRDTAACRTPCPSGTGTCWWRMCAGIRAGTTVLEVGIRAPSTVLSPPPLS
ncbi:hypothetical protein EXIGLDRAFT_697243 [Exidia glandulosa HHB12029]|uniref:Uncharacterized protein n=1 Tax=Exidia glandulosa HHB12029 TaxID=1314781 RepID=A0A165EW30_EXIGL|nr:hypothetical protein EXIGLDRAFT_697243 [Exidia glandulosa HHB12029]